MNKAILWDLDGTLLYTLQDLTNATNATLRAFGLAERSLEEVRTFVGNGAIQQMRRAVGGEPENFQEIMAYYRAYYPQHCNETTRPYAGILDTATALQAAGWRLAIVSNKPDNATKALWKTYFPPPSTWPWERGRTCPGSLPRTWCCGPWSSWRPPGAGHLYRRFRSRRGNCPGCRDSLHLRLLGLPE